MERSFDAVNVLQQESRVCHAIPSASKASTADEAHLVRHLLRASHCRQYVLRNLAGPQASAAIPSTPGPWLFPVHASNRGGSICQRYATSRLGTLSTHQLGVDVCHRLSGRICLGASLLAARLHQVRYDIGVLYADHLCRRAKAFADVSHAIARLFYFQELVTNLYPSIFFVYP